MAIFVCAIASSVWWKVDRREARREASGFGDAGPRGHGLSGWGFFCGMGSALRRAKREGSNQAVGRREEVRQEAA